MSSANQAHQGDRIHFSGGPRELNAAVAEHEQLRAMGMTSLEDFVSVTPKAYHPSTTPLSELTKIKVWDLRHKTRHVGSYLIVRLIAPASRTDAVLTIVEDENGLASDARLFNYGVAGGNVLKEPLLPGDVLLLKEPYVELQPGSKNPNLRLDHPSDVVRLRPHDERVPMQWRVPLTAALETAEAWKWRANELFRLGRFHAAIDIYTEALGRSPTDDQVRTIKINRAIAHIRVHQFTAALNDIESAPPGDDLVEKALCRKAESLYGLGRYRECCEVLKEVGLKFPGNTPSTVRLGDAVKRLIEQDRGKFNFTAMRNAAAVVRPLRLDFATFVGPVEVGPVTGKRRGVFTTKSVKAGELLLCEKAFAFGMITAADEPIIRTDAETQRTVPNAAIKLINVISDKLHHDGSQASVIADLHSGSYQRSEVFEVDGVPVVDSFHLERVVTLNAIYTPFLTHENLVRCMRLQPLDTKNSQLMCGLWPTVGHMNNACTFNVALVAFGDMLVVRATEDIAAGTELCRPYFSRDQSFQDTSRMLLEQYGITCHCLICEETRATEPRLLAKRQSLIGDTKGLNEKRGLTAAQCKGFVTELTKTYRRPPTEVPREAVSDIQHTAAAWEMENGRLASAITWAFDCLASMGFVIQGGGADGCRARQRASRGPLVIQQWGRMIVWVFDCWVILERAFALQGAFELAVQAREFAKISYSLCVGEDESFDKAFPRIF